MILCKKLNEKIQTQITDTIKSCFSIIIFTTMKMLLSDHLYSHIFQLHDVSLKILIVNESVFTVYKQKQNTCNIFLYIFCGYIIWIPSSVSNGHTIDSDEINLDNVEFETSMAKWELNLDMWTMCIYLFKKKDMEET